MTFLHFSQKKVRGRRWASGHETVLLDWANPLRLATASGLTGANVMTVPPAVGWLDVWKCRAVAHVVDVDAITDKRAKLYRIGQNTGYNA